MTHLVVGLYFHSTHLLTTTFVPGSDFEIREGEVPAPVEMSSSLGEEKQAGTEGN